MNEQQFEQADREVIAMVSGRKSRGGSLPGKAVHYIPEENANRILDLDNRIEKLRNNLPVIAVWTIAIAMLIIGINL